MKSWSRRVGALIVIAFLGVGVACGDSDDDPAENTNQVNNDQDPTNQNNNQEPVENNDEPNGNDDTGIPSSCNGDHETDSGEDEEVDSSPAMVDFESEYELIFNEFAFDPGTPGSSLNTTLAPFMDQERNFPIIVLVELTEIDADEGEVTIRAGAGLHAGEPGGGEYIWDDELEEPETTQGELDPTGWLSATLPTFNFVATMETEDEDNLKTIIPIRELQLDAMLATQADGSDPEITDGDLEGIIWYEDIKDLEIVVVPGNPGIPMSQALGQDAMNFDYSPDGTDCDGEADAWLMSATFSAEETVIVD